MARLSKGTNTSQVRTEQTTANTKVHEFKNAAGTVVASVDIEGDVAAHDAAFSGDVAITGSLTAGSATYSGSDFTTDVTVNTNKVTIAAASGNTVIAGTLGVTGNVAVNTNKVTITAASGNTAIAGTLGVTGDVAINTDKLKITAASGNTTIAGTLGVTGTISGPVAVISAASGTTALTAAQSGAVVVNTGTSGTTTFTLPSAAAGLHFYFVEGGDGAGELLINPYGGAGDIIVGKTHGAQDATGIATAANSGIKNTAATNVRGDHCHLVAITDGIWHMVSVAGVWAAS